ncbi:acetate uptake transporter [Paenibacillus pasadenensis]|uniref:acetate uptake transporter n=1 Tax=Paenibacillus pasadenensis TaxID=217090 RepID=UPI00203B0C29|nr:acetate uptake transporter [Paenibacillus pasadenensis]MCM3746667.1 acetate uptake transporter [Paenibacillus pasadenensis]
MLQSNLHHVKHHNADPSAIGLFGLAMVTLVASTQKLGWTDGYALVIPWAIFLGSLAQLFAAVEDSKRGNHFGTTAFAAYGLFWLGVASSWLIKLGVFGSELAETADGHQLGAAFAGYLIFTLFMTLGAAETNKALFLIFVLIDFLFLGLSLSAFGIAETFMHNVAAWSELLIALVSFYAMGANVLNNHFGYAFLPIGKPMGWFKKPN